MTALLEVDSVTISYGGRRAPAVVQRATLHVDQGEVVALVGESGSGKTTLARAVVGLVDISSGAIKLEGERLGPMRRRSRRQHRSIQMVFQDPRSSLNPRMDVQSILGEAWATHPDSRPPGDRGAAVAAALDRVGLSSTVARRRPTELSGGQCQRVSIARAIALKPSVIVCDEAVSALDVSVQAQILQLLVDLQREESMSLLFITHDLGVVRQIADRVVVMQHGEIRETSQTERLFTAPEHPYTQALLDAALDIQL